MRIDSLIAGDADAIARMLAGQDDEEGRFFDGLPSDAALLREVVNAAHADRYWAIRSDEAVVGIIMLRGWDAGYAVPSFGVMIARDFRGIGLGRLALQFAEAFCRLGKVDEVMLTVSEENLRAISLYESCGFLRTGERSAKGNLLYRKRLSR